MVVARIYRSWRNSWWITALLALLLLLIHATIHARVHPSSALQQEPWSVLPLLVGALVLNARQQSLLVALFLPLEIHHELNHHAGGVLVYARLILIVLLTIWGAWIRSRLEENSRALQAAQQTLNNKFERCLQASALAHELGQPLSQLMLQTRLVQHKLEQEVAIPAAALQPLEQLHHCGEQIQELTAAMSRLLRNTSIPSQRVDLADLMRGCLQQLEPTTRAAGIDLRLAGLHQPATTLGDRKQLEIALLNLLRNAQQSLLEAPAGQRLLGVAITQADSQIVLHIADSGAGLPSTKPEELTLNSGKSDGMGLGLLMVRSIARGHGGELQLGGSTELGGAEVSLSFPAAA
jgi:signal transduction histidine kinase